MKSRNKLVAILVIVIVALLGALVLAGLKLDKNRTGATNQKLPDTSAQIKDLIVLDSPRASDIVNSPLVIYGKARGNWYFEASFPVTILDEDGKSVAQGYATADGEWMTTDFVPFRASITFTKPMSKKGTLILRKDNPSGDPAMDKDLRVPILFY